MTYDGYLIKRPEIEITLPDEGQTLAKIALGQETRETMMGYLTKDFGVRD